MRKFLLTHVDDAYVVETVFEVEDGSFEDMFNSLIIKYQEWLEDNFVDISWVSKVKEVAE